MTAKYFVIQCIGFAGTLLFFFSYQCKSNRNLFRIQFLSYFIYTIHLILLGAMTGGISYIINTFRSFCLGGKWKSAKSWGMCAVICFLQIITLVLTWSGWISILQLSRPILPRQLQDIPIIPGKSGWPACLSTRLSGLSTTPCPAPWPVSWTRSSQSFL